MTMTTFVLLSIALFIMLISAVWASLKTINEKTAEIEHLTGEVSKQKENLAYLVKHAEEIATIQHDQNHIQEEINNAKTDEEVADIVNAIININNARVRK